MPIQVPVTQTGLEASIQAAAQKAGRNLKIDLGVSSRSIGALSQPLGKITGQADQFTKSMEAANARVLAFGASVGVLSAVAQGFKQIITTTIQVEKSMADINSVLGKTSGELGKFKNDIFAIAKETGASFQTVADAALEISRQGGDASQVLTKLKDSMILSRLSGLDAASAVEGLTAAVNSFSKEGVTTSEVLNKISKTAAAFSVSERDLIEGFKRSASVAQQAGVSLDELGGIITAVQQKTARGGAVIGNAFKTIFTRIQRQDSLAALKDIGAEITDTQGKLLPATKLIENLAGKIKGLNEVQVANITEKIGGGFQVGPLIAALDDITNKTSVFKDATQTMATANGEAYKRNTALNQTLAASINMATVNLQELANTLGEIGVTDSLKNILSFFNSFATDVKDVLQGEGLGSDFAKGLVKGISAVLSGPGLLLFAAVIGKLALNFVQFGAVALKTFFNIGSAAKEIGAIQSSIASTLLNNKSIQTQILALEGDRVGQAKFFSTALNTQLATMEKMRNIAASIAPDVFMATTGSKKRKSGNAGGYIPSSAGGYMPTVMAEANDIRKGVGGARPSDRPVVIPNFAFGGGKTGTMVAHTGEHVVPNYNGGSGSAIFNRDMVGRMGLPSNAQKIRGAGGFIPNFVDLSTFPTSNEPKVQKILDAIRVNQQARSGKTLDAWTGTNVKGGVSAEDLTEAKKLTRNWLTGKKEKVASSILSIDSSVIGGLGVASISEENDRKNPIKARATSFSADERTSLNIIMGGKAKGDAIESVEIPNIQIRTLSERSVGQQTNQAQFRQKILENFTEPTYRLASELGISMFPNDMAAVQTAFSGKNNSGKNNDKYLFSDSVIGGIFEAVVRTATSSISNIKSFNDTISNKPFDFEETGPAAEQFIKLFGFSTPLTKADGKKTATQASVSELVGKSLRDETISANMKKYVTKTNLAQGVSEVPGKASGYIPNFANQEYILSTLQRIKAGTSGFSKQEQETFLKKFGATGGTGKGISLKQVFDDLDSDPSVSPFINKAYGAAGATASTSQVFKEFERQIKANPTQLRNIVKGKGFIPNFADPLNEAISREIGAGVNPSQVYIDQNNSLKGPMNPSGLMVANRRDEPSGGWQGINRARKEGANAKTYGAAGGFVPNYADSNLTPYVGMTGTAALKEESRKYGEALTKLTTQILQLSKEYDQLTDKNTAKGVALEGEIKALNENKKALTDNSKKTREDIAKSTKGVLGSGKTALGREAKVSEEKLKGDMLGPIFAVQAALSGLAGATSNAEDEMLKYTNIVAEGASTFSSAAFAIQGLQSMGGKIGGIVSKLGPYGIAIAGGIALFNTAGEALDQFWGVTDKAAASMDKVAKASELAAFKLSDFSKSEQTRISKSGAGLVAGATITDPTKDFNNTVNFEGFDPLGGGKLKEALEKSVTESLAAGVSYDEMWNTIQSASLKGETITSEAVDTMIDKFSKLGVEAKKAKKDLSLFTQGEGLKYGKILSSMSEDRFEKMITSTMGFTKIRKQLALSGQYGKAAQDKTIREERERLRGTSAQKEELQTSLLVSNEKVLLDVLKKRLDTAIQLRSIMLTMPSALEQQLNIEKNLNSTLDSRKISIDNQLEANERLKNLVEEQSRNVSSVLTDKSFEGRVFGSLSATGKIDPLEFEKVGDIVSLITKEIEAQGGWNEKIAKQLNEQLATLQTIDGSAALQSEAREGIVQNLTEENNSIKSTMDLKNRIIDLEKQSLAISQAKNFVQEQTNRSVLTSLTNKNSELDAESRLAKARLESRKIAIEKGAIGGSNYSKSGSQSQIIKEEQAAIREELKRSNERIINDLQKSLLEKAFELKIDTTSFKKQFEDIKIKILADGEITPEENQQLKDAGIKFANEIESARKKEALASLKASFDKKQAELTSISNTLNAATQFKDIVVSAANEFKNIFNISKKEVESGKYSRFADPDQGQGPLGRELNQAARQKTYTDNMLNVSKVTKENIPQVPLANTFVDIYRKKTPIEKANSQLDEQQKEQEALISQTPNVGEFIPGVNTAFSNLEASALESKNSIDAFSNTLSQLGADATTFGNLVANVFKNLKEEAAQNQFSLLTATTPEALVSGGLERIKNTTLQTGPQTEDVVRRAAEETALLSKKLDYETAIDSVTKSRLKFEYDQTLKILELKEKLLIATSPEETIDLLKKIKEASLATEGIGSRLQSVFSPTMEEGKKNWEDSLVSSSIAFRNNIIDGLTQAIEEGGSLGDILQSAALDFARSMTKANLDRSFGAVQGAIGTLFRANGGPITGGSGNKDDVPAMLMGGEYVMNKRAVSKYGTGFMEALNNGSVSGFADGGSVIRSRGLATDVINSSNVGDQTGEGGFQMPGYYGSGAITGKKDLLSYASQAYTSGTGDIIGGGDNSAYIDITPESVRLTNFGRSQGPMAAAVRESKEQSLDLYFQQLAAEKQAKEEEKAQKKAFKRAIITALITSAVGAVVGAGAAGFKAGVAGAGPDAGFMGSLGAGAKGVFTGGDIGGGVMAGGLKNLFTGNYQLSQISDLKGYSQYLNKNPEEISKFLAGSASRSITGAGDGTLNVWSEDGSGPDGLPSFNTPFDSGLPNGTEGELLPPLPFKSNAFLSDQVPIAKATGGRIPQTSGIDTVPAMLSGGEFIMNAGATQRIGASNLNAMNSGASTETSSSAINDQLINKLDELIKITKESSKPVTVNVSSQQGQAGGDNQGEENKSEKDQNLSRKIKAAVIAVLQEEKRLGGVLRRS